MANSSSSNRKSTIVNLQSSILRVEGSVQKSAVAPGRVAKPQVDIPACQGLKEMMP
jgi:hypothetical protein